MFPIPLVVENDKVIPCAVLFDYIPVVVLFFSRSTILYLQLGSFATVDGAEMVGVRRYLDVYIVDATI